MQNKNEYEKKEKKNFVVNVYEWVNFILRFIRLNYM